MDPKVLETVNMWLTSANPTLASMLAVWNMVKEVFRRRDAGEPEMTFEENVQMIYDNGGTLKTVSETWLAENGFNPDGTKKS